MARGLEGFIKAYDIQKVYRDNKEYLVFYKSVRKDFGSSWAACNGIFSQGAYKPGNIVECKHWDTNRHRSCSSGLHVGTFSCAISFSGDDTPLVVEVYVEPKDVVCVPYGYDKIRCKKLFVNRLLGRRRVRVVGCATYSFTQTYWQRKLPNGNWSSGVSQYVGVLLNE